MVSDEMKALQNTDQKTLELRARNEARVAVIKASMGSKFVLHPDNSPKKVVAKRILK